MATRMGCKSINGGRRRAPNGVASPLQAPVIQMAQSVAIHPMPVFQSDAEVGASLPGSGKSSKKFQRKATTTIMNRQRTNRERILNIRKIADMKSTSSEKPNWSLKRP